jgi:SAM-dependent methyltransferase
MDGRTYRPLVKTLADMVLSHERSDSFRHILDIGCAYGYLVQELCARGREAWGIDFSPECIAASPVPERVRCLNALDVPLDRRYDAVVMTDIVEHLSDLDLMVLLPRLRKITRIVYMNINNCRHEPSHINIRSMWGWRRFMRAQGCRVDEANTRLARRIYISQQAGTEMWHKFTFFFNLHHD